MNRTNTAARDVLTCLRKRTRLLHEQLDIAVGEVATLDDYGRFLRGMDVFLECASRHLANSDHLVERRALLHLDLRDWGFTPIQYPHAGPSLARKVEPAAAGLGWQYVVAGSTLGARHVLRRVSARAYGALSKNRFLRRHANSDDWREFLCALHDAAPHQFEPMCMGAVEAFETAHLAFNTSFESSCR